MYNLIAGGIVYNVTYCMGMCIRVAVVDGVGYFSE